MSLGSPLPCGWPGAGPGGVTAAPLVGIPATPARHQGPWGLRPGPSARPAGSKALPWNVTGGVSPAGQGHPAQLAPRSQGPMPVATSPTGEFTPLLSVTWTSFPGAASRGGQPWRPGQGGRRGARGRGGESCVGPCRPRGPLSPELWGWAGVR